MEQDEALLAIAQIALGLAGFGGLFVAMNQAGARNRQPADTYRLVLLLTTALSTLLLSLLPVTLYSLGVTGDALWRISSALLGGTLGTLLVVFHRWRIRYREEIREGEAPIVAALLFAIAGIVLVAELLTAAGAIGMRPDGVFLTGLVFLVAFGSYLFARMLFLWRS